MAGPIERASRIRHVFSTWILIAVRKINQLRALPGLSRNCHILYLPPPLLCYLTVPVSIFFESALVPTYCESNVIGPEQQSTIDTYSCSYFFDHMKRQRRQELANQAVSAGSPAHVKERHGHGTDRRPKPKGPKELRISWQWIAVVDANKKEQKTGIPLLPAVLNLRSGLAVR